MWGITIYTNSKADGNEIMEEARSYRIDTANRILTAHPMRGEERKFKLNGGEVYFDGDDDSLIVVGGIEEIL